MGVNGVRRVVAANSIVIPGLTRDPFLLPLELMSGSLLSQG